MAIAGSKGQIQRSSGASPERRSARHHGARRARGRADFVRLTYSKPGFVAFMRNSLLAGLELDTGRQPRSIRGRRRSGERAQWMRPGVTFITHILKLPLGAGREPEAELERLG